VAATAEEATRKRPRALPVVARATDTQTVVRRFAWLLIVLPLAGCAGGPHYDFLATEDCLQRADVKFQEMTGKIEDGGDGTLQFLYATAS
jgi:hypothetical protein